MELKAGSRWRSAVCDTEVVLVRAPSAPGLLECGGYPMGPPGAERSAAAPWPDRAGGTHLGKRYVDPETGLEALCSKGGAGSLSFSGQLLLPKEAKPLPSSD